MNPFDFQESLLMISAGPTVSAPRTALAAATSIAAFLPKGSIPPLPSRSIKPISQNITPSINRASFGETISLGENSIPLTKQATITIDSEMPEQTAMLRKARLLFIAMSFPPLRLTLVGGSQSGLSCCPFWEGVDASTVSGILYYNNGQVANS
jgi:hypothetical protein